MLAAAVAANAAIYTNWITAVNLSAVTGLAPLYLGASASATGLVIIAPVMPNITSPKSGVTLPAAGTRGHYMGW